MRHPLKDKKGVTYQVPIVNKYVNHVRILNRLNKKIMYKLNKNANKSPKKYSKKYKKNSPNSYNHPISIKIQQKYKINSIIILKLTNNK